MPYYVWKNRGTLARPLPLLRDGYQGPYTLDTALRYARSAAVADRHGRVVSDNADPARMHIRKVYEPAKKFLPNHRKHAEDLAAYLQQEFDEGDYIDVAYDLFGEDVDVYDLDAEQLLDLKQEVERRERRFGHDCDTPAYRIFTDAYVAEPGQWYVHCTSASFSHFAYGVSVDDGIALTRVCGPAQKRQAPADNTDLERPFFEVLWGFAFPTTDSESELLFGARKYGGPRAKFLLFRSDEVVVAYHTGDDEVQALFVIGSEYDVVQGRWSGSGWLVEGDEETAFESLAQVVNWANRWMG